jgi:hypothetical protein
MKTKIHLVYDHDEDKQYADEFALFFGPESVHINDPKGQILGVLSDPCEIRGDSEVTVVLVGAKTSGRKAVDLEIAASLTPDADGSVNRLMGLLLPNCGSIPERLWDNLEPSSLFSKPAGQPGYAPVMLWEEVMPAASWYVGCVSQSVVDQKRATFSGIVDRLMAASQVPGMLNNRRPVMEADKPVSYWPWWV